MSSDVTYVSAYQAWGPTYGHISVQDSLGTHLAVLPITFLEQAVECDWKFILYVVHNVVNERGYLAYPDGRRVEAEDEIKPCICVFRPTDGDRVTFHLGPTMKHRLRPPNPAGSSTMSDSKRSTAQQSNFRLALVGRDYTCLLSDDEYAGCTASHIIPQSRPDIYQTLLNAPGPVHMFLPSMGLLLSDDLHHSYDRMEWSLLPKGHNQYVVHIFVPVKERYRQYHGKLLDRSRFRGPDSGLPDPVLLEWHYQQCTMARFRGFSCGFGLD